MALRHLLPALILILIVSDLQPLASADANIIRHDVITDPHVVLFPIGVDGKHGYIDVYGEVIIAPQFQSVGEFSEGLAFVRIRKGKGAYINSNGEIAIELHDYSGRAFSEGLAILFSRNPSLPRFVIIDKNGNIIVERNDKIIFPFSEGLARVRVANGKFGYLNKQGEFQIEPQFGFAYPFSDGLARIRMRGSYGYIGTDGEIKIEPIYWGAGSFKEGLAAVRDPRGNGLNIVFIDTTGNIVIDADIDNAGEFSEGLALFGEPALGQAIVPSLFGYLDAQGNKVIPARFIAGENFSEGLAPVAIVKNGLAEAKAEMVEIEIGGEFAGFYYDYDIEGKWGYIDKTGEFAIASIYDYAEPFENGLAYVRLGDEKGYINNKGELVWKGERRSKISDNG